MKKIVLISETLSGGVRKHLVDLMENIDKDKYEVYLLYSEKRADKVFWNKIEHLNSLKIKMYNIENFDRDISLKSDIKGFIRIFNTIKRIDPDVVHCHSSKAGALGRVAAKILGVKKIIYTPHAYMFQNPNTNKVKKTAFMLLEKYLSKITNLTLNVSEGERKVALQKGVIKESDSKVIFNGVNPLQKNNNSQNKHDTLWVGTIGRMDDQKDPFTFLEIAKTLIPKYPNLKFAYVGDGIHYDEMKRQISKDMLGERLLLFGFQDNPTQYLNTFDIFISTSLYEGFPYSLLEALSASLPIVATNVTGNNEIVVDGKNGYLFEPKNISEAVAKIEKIINSQVNSINELGKESLSMYEKSFTIKKMINQIESVYE
ncbi:glycosyltransferase family 4 protein [Rossellomorea sp. KS-H15a]|uniref:glycosyltransferase family 4 protein n=1 Tax=Rossellomorea sp. KS-H15a TaxID=2963940 RepID=UPI0020C5CDE2|nr:glycosyltransferase family 4 protein [Rossellomorea sp. KS-H15a]UTE77500.1 glycosyltransferase family 4 protein [Rossellomorea sp. KS-H15a]